MGGAEAASWTSLLGPALRPPGPDCRDGSVCLPCWHFPPPRPSQFFLPCLWGMGDGSLPLPTATPAHRAPLPPSLPQEAKEGEGGGGGAGLPLGTAVAQSISPKPRNFLLPKRKKKKKKFPSGHLSSLPHWDSRDWICGVSREGGSGLEHSQARVVEFPVRPSARPTLGFSPLLSSFPSKQTTRGGLPLTSGPWAGGLGGWGLGRGCRAAQKRGAGGGLGLAG